MLFLGRTLQFYDETCCTKTFVFCHFLFSFESQFQFYSLIPEIHDRLPSQLLHFLAFICVFLKMATFTFACVADEGQADGLVVMKDSYQMIFFVFFLFIISFDFSKFFLSQGIIFLPSFYIKHHLIKWRLFTNIHRLSKLGALTKQEASTILPGTVSHPHNHI